MSKKKPTKSKTLAKQLSTMLFMCVFFLFVLFSSYGLLHAQNQFINYILPRHGVIQLLHEIPRGLDILKMSHPNILENILMFNT